MRIQNLLKIDFIILAAVLLLAIIGVLFIYSSGIASGGLLISNEYQRQILWISIGLILALIIAVLNYRRLHDSSLYLYLGTIFLLLCTFVFARLFDGSRWLKIGSFSFQASEFSKITTILFLAWYLDTTKRAQKPLMRFMVSGVIVLIPTLLVLLQPDLGTALVFIPIFLGMTYIAGLPVRYIIFFILCLVSTGIFLILPHWQTIIMNNSIPALMTLTNVRFVMLACLSLSVIAAIAAFGFIRYQKKYFYWISYVTGITIFSMGVSLLAQKVLREYQIMRLIIFMNPNVDPRGSGWHIIQSTTAIVSGGVFGKGYLQGTQSQYRFLPEQSTDFIFSILSEEWGFLGGILVFALYCIVLLRLVRIMRLTTDSYGAYIVTGLIFMYAIHFTINVGMTMGIMPITGIPLLFVSYGGSALISAMVGIGLALSVYVRRYLH